MAGGFDALLFKGARPQTRDELFSAVTEHLLAQEYVRESYGEALVAREAEFPTGLPFPGGVAIPHTSAEHVLRDALVVVSSDRPLLFHEMGANESADEIPVELVIFLVISNPEGQVPMLSALIAALQDEDFRQSLKTVEDEDVLHTTLSERLPL